MEELLNAIATEENQTDRDITTLIDPQTILEICGSLVDVVYLPSGESSEVQETIVIAHFSVSEYINPRQETKIPDTFQFTDVEGNEELARICLRYLTFDEFREGPCQHPGDFISRPTYESASQYFYNPFDKRNLDQVCESQFSDDENILARLHEIGTTPYSIGKLRDRARRYPFLQYAARYWRQHYLKGDRSSSLSFVERLHTVNEITETGYEAPYFYSALENEYFSKFASYLTLDLQLQLIQSCAETGLVIPCNGFVRCGMAPKRIKDVYESSLYTACSKGEIPVAAYALETGYCMKESKTKALIAATQHGQFSIIELLIQNEVDINDGTDNGKETALGVACTLEAEQTVRFLISHGADVNGFNGQALARACQISSVNIAKILLSAGACANAKGDRNHHVLEEACFQGNNALVLLLLKHGANPNVESTRHIEYGTPLQAASYFGHAEVVETLLVNDAKVNTLICRRYSNALQSACAMCRTDTCRVLLKYGVDVNADLSILSHEFKESLKNAWAQRTYDDLKPWTVTSLLEQPYYGSALDTAAHKGNEEIVRILIASGADVNASGGMYGCPLQAACACGDQYGDPELHSRELALAKANIVRMLLDHGARVGTLGGIYGDAFCAALEARFLNTSLIFQLLLGRSTEAIRLRLFHTLLARQKRAAVKDAPRRHRRRRRDTNPNEKLGDANTAPTPLLGCMRLKLRPL